MSAPESIWKGGEEWITARELARRLGVSKHCANYWRNYGVPSLSGRKLNGRRIRVDTGSNRRKVWYCRASWVDSIFESLPLADDARHQIEHAGEPYLSTAAFAQRSGLSTAMVHRYRSRQHTALGRTITTIKKRVRPVFPKRGGWPCSYSPAREADIIRQSRQHSGKYTMAQAARKLGVAIKTLRQRMHDRWDWTGQGDVLDWTVERSPAKNGQYQPRPMFDPAQVDRVADAYRRMRAAHKRPEVMIDGQKCVRTEEAAKRLNRSVVWLHRLARKGIVTRLSAPPGRRTCHAPRVYWPIEDLDRILAEQRLAKAVGWSGKGDWRPYLNDAESEPPDAAGQGGEKSVSQKIDEENGERNPDGIDSIVRTALEQHGINPAKANGLRLEEKRNVVMFHWKNNGMKDAAVRDCWEREGFEPRLPSKKKKAAQYAKVFSGRGRELVEKLGKSSKCSPLFPLVPPPVPS